MAHKFRRMKTVGIAVVIAMLGAPTVTAQVTLSIDSLQADLSLPNGISQDSSADLPITIAHQGDATNWFVTVSRGGSAVFDPRQAEIREKGTWYNTDYNVYTPAGQIARDLTVTVGADEVVSGSFSASAGGQTQTSTFSVRIPAGQYVLATTYSDAVDVTLYRGSPTNTANAVQIEQREVTISPVTFAVVMAGIVPPGGAPGARTESYEMDFGALTPGGSRTADLILRANTTYEVEASSRHGGQLFLYPNTGPDTAPDLNATPIPYDFIYDGKSYNLQNIKRVEQVKGKVADPTFPFERRTIEVVIGDFADLPAGTYRDVVSLTISAF